MRFQDHVCSEGEARYREARPTECLLPSLRLCVLIVACHVLKYWRCGRGTCALIRITIDKFRGGESE